MRVACTHCGEEILGAVNRCWKCGRTIGLQAGDFRTPPVRRLPPTVATQEIPPIDAVLEAGSSGGVPAVVPSPSPHRVLPTRSPFTPGASLLRTASSTLTPISALEESRSPKAVRTPSRSALATADAAAIVSLVVALASLMLAPYFPIATLAMALGAIGMGVWGLQGPRRGVALASLLLACCALAWGGFEVAVLVYQAIYGRHPFA